MANVPNGEKHCRKFQPAEWVARTLQTDSRDRPQRDGPAIYHIANVNVKVSSRLLKIGVLSLVLSVQ